ncbi:MAG: AAA family ATPase [Eubacterium sp.]|nr:AAA family ATPase [Eubacterium sp.]
MARTVAIGEQDFSKIITYNSLYVDKSGFIKEWWDNRDTVTLITRPRRFGKTLTMSMVDYFFSIKHAGRSDLFENCNIWKEKEYRKLQGTYPVIFLSFANVKGGSFRTIRKKICQLIVDLYEEYQYLIGDAVFRNRGAAYFERISVDMDDADLEISLNQLSRYLYRYYGKNVIILLDEYDTPMQEAYVHGYWDELANLIRGLFHSAFKTNPYLERALMTGITRISKESIFSDLNNLEVVSATSCKYKTVFGFTEQEVFEALREYGLQDQAGEVRKWYDGFRFGDCTNIYNPWSITKFLEEKKFAPYWANTSSNALVGKLILDGNNEIKMMVEDLIRGRSLVIQIDEQLVFDQLDQNPDAIWSLLLASGYLKIAGLHSLDDDRSMGLLAYELMLTNFEVYLTFRKMIQAWFAAYKQSYHGFIKAVLANNLESMNILLNKIMQYVVSFFDAGTKPSEDTQPERFYHGLVLGLMVDLENRYIITSNRESGYGRYDVLLEPRNDVDDGIILEFKVNDPKKEKGLEDTVQSAIRQILDKKYAAVLEARGIKRNHIRIYGFAFSGKEVMIDGGTISAYESFTLP